MKELLGWSFNGALDPWSCFQLAVLLKANWLNIKSTVIFIGLHAQLHNHEYYYYFNTSSIVAVVYIYLNRCAYIHGMDIG